MSHNNAYFQCPVHGSIYVLRDVTVYSTMDFRQLEPLHRLAPPVEGNDKVACPICGKDYRIFFGD